MISWLARQFRYLYGFFRTNDTPRQLALGLALGIVLGLTPKGNLIAVLLAMLLLTLRVNVQAGMLGALGVSFVAASLDPISSRIGESLLTTPMLHGLWTKLYNIPFVPWTGFNNTVVLGSFVLGCGLFYPAYRLSLPVFHWQAERRERQKLGAKSPKLSIHDDSSDLVATSDSTERDAHVISIGSSPQAIRARQDLRRHRFNEFLAEVESISQRRGAA